MLDPISPYSLRHHPVFYFVDGNICLIAQQTVFKIYKGLLAKDSAVFSDMGAIPTPKDQEMHDGTPCVRLDDSADDLEELFHLMWNTPRKLKKPVPELCALLRLSNKYMIDEVQNWAADQLEEDLPCSPVERMLVTLEHYRSNPKDAIDVLATAKKCGLPRFLPLTFYWLACQTSTASLLASGASCLEHNEVIQLFVIKEAVRATWTHFIESLAKFPDHRGKGCKGYAQRQASGSRKQKLKWDYDYDETYEDQSCTSSTYSVANILKLLKDGDRDPLLYLLSAAPSSRSSMCSHCSSNHKKLCDDVAKNIADEMTKLLKSSHVLIPHLTRCTATESCHR